MYFLNLKGLVEELKISRERSKESFSYSVAFIIADSIAGLFKSNKETVTAFSLADIPMTALIVVISFFLLRNLYDKNGGDEGKHFLDKLIALSWVTGMQVSILFIPLFVAFKLYREYIGLPFLIFSGIILIGGMVYAYISVSKSLKEIRQSEISELPQEAR